MLDTAEGLARSPLGHALRQIQVGDAVPGDHRQAGGGDGPYGQSQNEDQGTTAH